MSIRAWAHAIVRRYPQAWRERYEAEVRGLIDDTRMQFSDLGELLRGLFTERARELLLSDEHPRRTATIEWVAIPILGGLFVGVAGITGFAVGRLIAPLSDPAVYATLALFCVIALAVGRLMIRGAKRRDAGRPFILPPDIAVRVLPLVFVAVGLYAAVIAGSEPSAPGTIPAWVHWLYQWTWFSLFAGSQIASFLPGQELLQTFAKISFAEGQIRTSEQWVAGCRDMISKGVPSPLNDALEQVGRWTVERDMARARLKDLGYRARFRGPIGQADGPEATI